MIINTTPSSHMQTIRSLIRTQYQADESLLLEQLVATAALHDQDKAAISARAANLVRSVRGSSEPALMENFLAEYGLSSREGVALMCLAEALLRVPDNTTIDDLIQDKIAPHNWSKHLGNSNSFLVNASTWGLMFTGQVLDPEENGLAGTVRNLVRRLGEPVIRVAVGQAMKEMGAQFVLGRTIKEAFQRGQKMLDRGYTHSFDMLGEAAMTEADAQRYHGAYAQAIASLSAYCTHGDIRENPGISVKLSALHPRYEVSNKDEAIEALTARTLQLAVAAKAANMGFNIDAEEADRLDLSLDIIEQILASDQLAGWDGFGIVVQAYGKRAASTLDWLYALAEKYDRKIMVRLVKGAYWDTEIKKVQVEGLPDYPVFTRKSNTDVSYIACARKLLNMRDRVYPQFATHNAHSVAAVMHMAGTDTRSFEFQRLHGMGDTLYGVIEKESQTRCRIYAPVGEHQDLLAYLVRRLLENGANSSFVNQIVDHDVAPEDIAKDPIDQSLANAEAFNTGLARPAELFGKSRTNSKGWDIHDFPSLESIESAIAPFAAPYEWHGTPLTTATSDGTNEVKTVINPTYPDQQVGTIKTATIEQSQAAIQIAKDAQPAWAALPCKERAATLSKAADLFEAHAEEFFALLRREAGKTLMDCVSEVREAVDFLRYYANEAKYVEKDTGARGVIVCISPWNFPFAIFSGQLVAALVTGNAVVAKPADQTPLIAVRAVELLHEAGIPQDILHLLPGRGSVVGQALISDSRIAGICFTGSTEVAQHINTSLAENANSEAIFIAETGGMNAMIMDSSALPEQVVQDVMSSSFQSAGQRCSALRVLFVQKDVEEKVVSMICGAMDELSMDDPALLRTDLGPVIDARAKQVIDDHCQAMTEKGRVIKKLDAADHLKGFFCEPHLIRLTNINELEKEIFGPVLHVVTYDVNDLDQVCESINQTGYGLTFGVHSRIDGRVQNIVDAINVGNYYVNRNQIGAVVGCQPFGGHGLSGTGPKAGGPLYLRRFRKADNTASGLEFESAEAAVDTAAQGSTPVTAADIDKAALQLDQSALSKREDKASYIRGLLKGEAKEAMRAAAALDMGPMELPGPTGESNQYKMVARGFVVCLGETSEVALAQTVQALVAGNKVVTVLNQPCKDMDRIYSRLTQAGLPLAVIHGQIDAAELSKINQLAAVAFIGTEAAQLEIRQALSGRSGTILPLISEIIYPDGYVLEKTVSTDTTAAGGNAQLLAEIS